MALSRSRWIGAALCVASVLATAPLMACGGGGDAPPPAARPSPTQPSAGAPAAFSSGGGGGGGYVGGGGGGGGLHAGAGGYVDRLAQRERQQQDRTILQHRGPERLTGLTPEQQAARDLASAGRGAIVTYDPHDDACERAWTRRAAVDTSYRAIRHDGIAPRTGARERAGFLAYCHAQPPETQQCWDHDYRQAHLDDCNERMSPPDGARQQLQRRSAAGVRAVRELYDEDE